MFKQKIARTIVLSIVMGLLAWSALAMTASASVTPATFTRVHNTATSVSTTITKTSTGQLMFSPSQLTVQKTAIGGSFFVTNMTGQTQMLALNGHAAGVQLVAGEIEQITLLQSTATGTYQFSLMPTAVHGTMPTLTVRYVSSYSSATTATSPVLHIQQTSTGQLVFSPNQLTIQKTALESSFLITNMTGQTRMLALNGHSVGIHLLPGQTEQITLNPTTTGIYHYTLMPTVSNGPVLTVIVK